MIFRLGRSDGDGVLRPSLKTSEFFSGFWSVGPTPLPDFDDIKAQKSNGPIVCEDEIIPSMK